MYLESDDVMESLLFLVWLLALASVTQAGLSAQWSC